jgi:hypothetical protein
MGNGPARKPAICNAGDRDNRGVKIMPADVFVYLDDDFKVELSDVILSRTFLKITTKDVTVNLSLEGEKGRRIAKVIEASVKLARDEWKGPSL